MGLFDKKYCDICGEPIKFLGNRKLEDGNLCKDCAEKLSPFFDERRHSTVEEIRAQIDYREQNREAVKAFHTTKTFGTMTKVLIDEAAGKFMVTASNKLEEANPDVIDLSQVTNCRLDIDEKETELMQKNQKGEEVPYNPKRFHYDYDFYTVIDVNHPYFQEIRFKLNNSSVDMETVPTGRGVAVMKPDPRRNVHYVQFKRMGEEIVAALSGTGGAAPFTAPTRTADGFDVQVETGDAASKVADIKAQARAFAAQAPAAAATAAAAQAPAGAKMRCPFCDSETVPTPEGKCEFCGAKIV